MLYAAIGLVVLASIGLAIYALLEKSELVAQVSALQRELREQDASSTAAIDALRAELANLDKIRHIPDIIAKSKKLEADVVAKLGQAQKEADEIVLIAHKDVEWMKERNAARVDEAQRKALEILQSATQEANSLKQRIISETEGDAIKAIEARRVAEWQAKNVIEEAQKKAREIASQARKEAKEKTQKVDDNLLRAASYALEIREKAEARAQEIGGQAYEALKRHKFYEAAAKAMQNVVDGYSDTYMVPASHVLDELYPARP